MNDANQGSLRGPEIPDVEKGTIFVTMNATFKDEEKCRVAMETIVRDAHAAYGVDSHFWFRSEDGRSLFVVERYVDEKALRQAIRRFTSARLSFFRSIKVANVSVYGDVSLGVRVMFSPLRPKYMRYYGGYSKLVRGAEEAGIRDFERKRVFVATNLTFKATQDDENTRVVERLLRGAYAEPGNRSHFWVKGKDGRSTLLLEQYADEEALVDHLKANPASRSAFLESVEVADVFIYGAGSDEVKEAYAALEPTYMRYYGGYSK